MSLKQRYEAVLGWFAANVPVAESELRFESPFQLLVAVILSAQCTDKRVNMVTPSLFARFPDAASLAQADFEQVFDLVKSVSYPRSKTTHIIEASRLLVERHGGEVPDDMDALMALPGVGRKTASVVSAIVYNRPVIAVDTHIFRVSHRLGLSKARTPEGVSDDLEAHVPEELRPVCHHWLLLHGRYVCTARNPRCAECGLKQWCKSFKPEVR